LAAQVQGLAVSGAAARTGAVIKAHGYRATNLEKDGEVGLSGHRRWRPWPDPDDRQGCCMISSSSEDPAPTLEAIRLGLQPVAGAINKYKARIRSRASENAFDDIRARVGRPLCRDPVPRFNGRRQQNAARIAGGFRQPDV